MLIGNPLPVIKHPLRMAEELAEIDLISRGRLITGWVRGAGSEQFFNNANPAYNREMFNEAHDFIVQAWTRPGPWRYEGKHFHYRHVNPWALPYQKPLSADVDSGGAQPGDGAMVRGARLSIFWSGHAARADLRLVGLLRGRSGQAWLPGGSGEFRLPDADLRGGDRGQGAGSRGKNFVFGGGQNAFSRAEHTLPPGYNSKSAIRALAKQPKGSWLGVSGDKMRGSMRGRRQRAGGLSERSLIASCRGGAEGRCATTR